MDQADQTRSASPTCWVLQHSGLQVMALADDQLTFSRRLKKREVPTITANLGAGSLEEADLHHTVSISAIERLRVDTTRRHLTIITADEEILVPGFPSSTSEWIHRLGVNEIKRDPLGPLAPVVDVARLIAERAGLVTTSDERAEALHYGPPASLQVSLPRGTFGSIALRPWQPLRQMVVLSIMLVGGYMVLLRPIEQFNPPMYTPVLFGLFLIAGVIHSLAIVAKGVTIDGDGVSGAALTRHRSLPWADIALVHSTLAEGDARNRSAVEIVLTTGKTITLPKLSRQQTMELAAALDQFGTPHGVGQGIEVLDGDALTSETRQRVRSPIAVTVGGLDL